MLKRLRKIRLKYSFSNRADFDLTKVRVCSRAEVILQQYGERSPNTGYKFKELGW